nr:uncharacterized protein LOC109160345 [Ipomoea batatas]
MIFSPSTFAVYPKIKVKVDHEGVNAEMGCQLSPPATLNFKTTSHAHQLHHGRNKNIKNGKNINQEKNKTSNSQRPNNIVFRPRAVLSSPDNDMIIGNRKKLTCKNQASNKPTASREEKTSQFLFDKRGGGEPQIKETTTRKLPSGNEVHV